MNIETYPGQLELPLTGTNFHGPQPVRAIEVLFIRSRYGAIYDAIQSLNGSVKLSFCQSHIMNIVLMDVVVKRGL